jgi:hydrogenase expression/formation protein HypC
MCLGIPMQILDIEGSIARCRARGVERDVSLFMMAQDAVKPGDFVMVHVGYAIQKIAEHDARSRWELFDEMLADKHGPG